jgi:hypothetical protein
VAKVKNFGIAFSSALKVEVIRSCWCNFWRLADVSLFAVCIQLVVAFVIPFFIYYVCIYFTLDFTDCFLLPKMEFKLACFKFPLMVKRRPCYLYDFLMFSYKFNKNKYACSFKWTTQCCSIEMLNKEKNSKKNLCNTTRQFNQSN